MTPRPRREKPVKFLDAHLVPVEQALLARAAKLEEDVHSAAQPLPALVADHLAAEFRALADELRYW